MRWLESGGVPRAGVIFGWECRQEHDKFFLAMDTSPDAQPMCRVAVGSFATLIITHFRQRLLVAAASDFTEYRQPCRHRVSVPLVTFLMQREYRRA